MTRKQQTLIAVLLLGGGVVGFDRFFVLDAGPASASAAEGPAAGEQAKPAAGSENKANMISVSRVLETLRDEVDPAEARSDAFALPASWNPDRSQQAPGSVSAASAMAPEEFVSRHVLTGVEQRTNTAGRLVSTYSVAVLDGTTDLRVIDRIDGYTLELITPEEVRFVGPAGVTVTLSRTEAPQIKRK